MIVELGGVDAQVLVEVKLVGVIRKDSQVGCLYVEGICTIEVLQNFSKTRG